MPGFVPDTQQPRGRFVPDKPAQEAKPQTLTEKAGLALRQQGRNAVMNVADLYRGATSLVNLPFDALAQVQNYATSKLYPHGYDVTINGQKVHRTGLIPSATQQNEEALRSLGVPQAVTPSEQFVGAAMRGAGGALTSLGFGGALSGSASPVVSGVGRVMAAEPASQIAAGAGAGASSDIARQMGGGPLTQTAAGLVGGVAAGGLTSALTNPRERAPSIESLRESANRAYAQADDAGVAVSKNSLQPLAADIERSVRKLGYDPGLNGEVTASLKRLAADSTNDLSLSELEILRKVFKGAATKAAGSQDDHTEMLAYAMINKLDDFVENLNPSQVTSGDPAKAMLLREARNYYSRMAKGEEIQQIMDTASIRGRQNVSLTGYEQALRVEFGKIARNPNRLRLFKPDEQEAIKLVASGGGYLSPTNLLRYLGKLAPTNVVSGGVGAGAGYVLAGGPGIIGVPALGGAARLGATALTMRNANLASELVRRGGQLPPGAGVLAPNFLPATVGTTANALYRESERTRNALAR